MSTAFSVFQGKYKKECFIGKWQSTIGGTEMLAQNSVMEHNHTDTCLAWSGDLTNTPQIHSHGIWCDVGRRILTETTICCCGKCVLTQQVSSPRRPASHPPWFRPCEWPHDCMHTKVAPHFFCFGTLKVSESE
jgi:hypothetical protein